MHAGSNNDFIPEASLIFASKTNDPDFHGKMNKDNFPTWFRDQLLTKLEEPPIIIMDNASYHSSLVEKVPNSSWKKVEIQNWLREKKLEFPNNALKGNLFVIVASLLRFKLFLITFPEISLLKYMLQIKWSWNMGMLWWDSLLTTVFSILLKIFGDFAKSIIISIAMWQTSIDTVTPEIWKRTVAKGGSI
ncbi:hypothetical protein ILUMI_02660 [Ignelater luminosus]|uniref:Uncharacterized protein n=1 Tax=Ignelater luminosus TaxID=2038154 RepID=A0A8K0GL59_IGNLU|nr:hypothetical protein ILUMI_02660 [Ignelater luminosus]